MNKYKIRLFYNTTIFVLLILAPFVISAAIEREPVFIIKLMSTSRTFELDSIIKSQGFPDKQKNESEFSIQILSFNDEIIYENYFNTFIEVFVPDSERYKDSDNFEIPYGVGEEEKVELSRITLTAPYFKTAEFVNIKKGTGGLILKIDVSKFADLCGDAECQRGENHYLCPEDCASGEKEGYCDKAKDGICDPDCSEMLDRDCRKESSGRFWVYAISALFIIVIAFIIVIIRRRNQP